MKDFLLYDVQLQNCGLDPEADKLIKISIRDINKYFPDTLKREESRIYIFLERHNERENYEVSITFFFGKNYFTVHAQRHTAVLALHSGFRKLHKMIRNFKGRHVVGDYEHPLHA